MIRALKTKLLPNNKQKTKLFQYVGTMRFAYNWALSREKENYENGNKFLNDCDLRKEFTKMKQQPEYRWLYNVSCDVAKQAIKDAVGAYKNFFKKQTNYPKFKSKKNSKQSFYQDNFKIKFTDSKVYLTNIGYIKLAEKNRYPIGDSSKKEISVSNPRITFDGLNWWLSCGIEVEKNKSQPKGNGIGIDIGIKDLAVCSDGNTYKNINKTEIVKKLKKKERRLERSLSKKYEKNKKGDSYCKTNNIIKSKNKLLKIRHRLKNIRHNYLHQVTTEIIKREPSFICVENLNVSGMMKNKYLSKAIQEQCFYELYLKLEYKSKWNNIQLIKADRFFPSSKLCSNCGSIKSDLKLKDRIYKCDCGNVIDRDYQASINLYEYGKQLIA